MSEPVDALLYGVGVGLFSSCAVRELNRGTTVRGVLGPGLLLLGSLGLLVFRRGDVHSSEVAISLAAVCGMIAAGSLLYSTYREHVVVGRLVSRLRDPERRAAAISELRARLQRAQARGDILLLEDAIRHALEPLILAGCWDDVAWFASHAKGTHRRTFEQWLCGVHALAELHAGDPAAAARALEGVAIEGGWLVSIEALRLALAGDGAGALERLEEVPRRPGAAVIHQRRLAQVHGLVAVGRREEARKELLVMQSEGSLEAALEPVGPASGLAASMLGGASGPFRASA